ncbi:sulfite exporter TauE/SafE family protein [Massilia sp. ST3]|uniref:sulfite exporter TauE/SafE family protein n=1 Tax=Massilia sp. ST3 TaxID=2824903 RepID=UPI001B81E4A5|nr:sulfite exporter TauE/SafE family protein [Massilia sp. ST3]MBQ5946117.1 sulfite exporter TauE/SafE family protein [Massilia sp. ST3]
MHGLALFPVFLVGLFGSVHCAGMCGGIVGALSVGGAAPQPARPAFPVPVRTVTLAPAAGVAAYNTGRIASYMAAGALAGGAAAGAARFAALPALQEAAYWAANLMLVALGLFLMDAWRGLARLEQGGQALWRHVRPLLRRVGPPSTPGRMLAAGALWGWLPCGMVYSVLATAMLSGSAVNGAAVMLAFGLGTLPMLAMLGLAGQRLRARLQAPRVRLACGLVIAAFGLAGLARAAGGLPDSWVHLVCIGAGSAA